VTFMPRFPPDELVEIQGRTFLLRTEFIWKRPLRDPTTHQVIVDAAGEAVMEVGYHVHHVPAGPPTPASEPDEVVLDDRDGDPDFESD
jgi:hypothetical protein